jgi:hypothetical protein
MKNFCCASLHAISNRSHVTSNRVSDVPIRILKIRDQRLASEIGRLPRKIQKITRQRLSDVSLTLGNVARIFANRTQPKETALPGWVVGLEVRRETGKE